MNRLSFAISALLLLSAAPHAYADDTDFNGIGKPVAGADRPDGPCQYADSKMVEDLLGEPLIVPPFSKGGSGPDVNGTTCRYEVKGYRSLDVDMMKQGGDRLFETLTGFAATIDRQSEKPGNLNRILGLDGEWDEVRMAGPNRMIALQGDGAVLVTVNGLALSQDGVAQFIDDVYKQIDAPAGDDGKAGVAAARVLEEQRPKPRDVCGLIGDDDIRDTLGLSAMSRKRFDRSCDWFLALSDGSQGSVSVKVAWNDGSSESVMLSGTMGVAQSIGIFPPDQMQRLEAERNTRLPDRWTGMRNLGGTEWDSAFGGGILLGALKNDVFVALSIAVPHLTPRQEVDLLKRIMVKLN